MPRQTKEHDLARYLYRYTRAHIESLLHSYLRLPFKQLMQISEDDNTNGLDRIIVSIILKAVESGDPNRLNMFLDRMIGKVKEIPEDIVTIEQLPIREAIELGKKALLTLEQEANE